MRPKLEAGILIAIIIGWLALWAYQGNLEQHASRLPDTATQQTVPVQWKSTTLYMTPQDARFERNAFYVELCMVGIAVLIFLGRRSKRR